MKKMISLSLPADIDVESEHSIHLKKGTVLPVFPCDSFHDEVDTKGIIFWSTVTINDIKYIVVSDKNGCIWLCLW